MSKIDRSKSIEVIKNLLKSIREGADISRLKEKFREVLKHVSPFEIPLIEQQLIREGVSINEILRLCDLHVELFREFLESKELGDVPKGHPLYLLMRENDLILKNAEALSLYANTILDAKSPSDIKSSIDSLKKVLIELGKIRIHYRKIQMLIFPYLERRGIDAVPRVLWGREDRVITMIRDLMRELSSLESSDTGKARKIAEKTLELSREITELVFRENKILYPTVWILLSEGEWAAIHEMGKEIGYLVEYEEEWVPKAKPVYPYEVSDASISREQLERLPKELRTIVSNRGIKPDTYKIAGKEDLDLGTGFLNIDEIKTIFSSLPLELTFANKDDRVKFYTNSKLVHGFTRTKTIIGRKVEYCHPPRLEPLVKKVIKELRETGKLYREFWTRLDNRIIRVLIVAVRNEKGEYLGSLEIVEDLTEVVLNPDEVKKKILVL